MQRSSYMKSILLGLSVFREPGSNVFAPGLRCRWQQTQAFTDSATYSPEAHDMAWCANKSGYLQEGYTKPRSINGHSVRTTRLFFLLTEHNTRCWM